MSKHIVVDARIRRSSTGRYADRLIEHLQEVDKQNRYTILVEPDDPWEPTSPNFSVKPCRYAQFSFNPLDQLGFALQLKRLKPDLVHFTMTQQPIFYFGNIVTTTHDLTMLEYARAGRLPQWMHQLRMALYKFLMWWSHKKSKKIIVPSDYVRADVAKYHPFAADRLVVTLEASEPPMAVRAEKPSKAKEPYLLYVGRAFPHKNLETLVKAFEKLLASQPELFLILAGKKEHYYEQLEEFASKSPARSNIIFTGFVSDAELKWLYENAVAYTFPSLSEGFGLPGLEAMAHGCPVVSSNATCLPEVYQDAAIYFDPTDPADIAEKIQFLLDNEAAAKDLVARGKKLLPKYSWRKMAEETQTVYQDLLG